VSSNSHFGLVCFSDTAPTPLSPTSAWTGTTLPPNDYTYNIDGGYILGNEGGGAFKGGTFYVPGIALNTGNDNWGDGVTGPIPQSLLGAPPVSTIVGNTVTQNNNSPQWSTLPGPQSPPCVISLGATDINGALNAAYNDVTTNARANATTRAIVLFTDGVPDVPDFATGMASAQATATTIGGAGIPVYTIGLATNGAIEPYEDQVLSDNVHAFTSPQQGVAYDAYNAGASQSTYFPATTSTLNTAFQSIARSLCVIQ